jgi:ferritin
MISKRLSDRVNAQIEREMYSAYLYMAMSAKATAMGYGGVAKWFMVQYHEEMYHAMKLYKHLVERGAEPSLATLPAPQPKDATVKAMFERALEHEKTVTASIRELLELAIAEKDYSTENLVRWYVDEQVEEEKNAVNILRDLELLGDGKQGLFMLNIELGKRSATIPLDFTFAVD